MERVIKGYRGCITTGYKSIDDFSHCGNDKCESCNMLQDAIGEEIKKQLEKFKTFGGL